MYYYFYYIMPLQLLTNVSLNLCTISLYGSYNCNFVRVNLGMLEMDATVLTREKWLLISGFKLT